MPLKWAANENPVGSAKLNKMSVTFWANEAAIVTTEVQIGSIVYLEDKAALFKVKTISPLALASLGGGGMVIKFLLGYFFTIDPPTRAGFGLRHSIEPADTGEPASQGNADVINLFASQIGIESKNAGSGVATYATSQLYQNANPITFAGKGVGKVFVRVPLSASFNHSPTRSASLKLNATNCKIEILDGVTVKGTISLANDVTNAAIDAGSHDLSYILSGIVDLAGYVFTTDFRIKVYTESTVSDATNGTNHRHKYLGYATDYFAASYYARVGICEVELA